MKPNDYSQESFFLQKPKQMKRGQKKELKSLKNTRNKKKCAIKPTVTYHL
jgi:hypothetical protein